MADAFFSSSWRILEPYGCAGIDRPVASRVVPPIGSRLSILIAAIGVADLPGQVNVCASSGVCRGSDAIDQSVWQIVAGLLARRCVQVIQQEGGLFRAT